MLASHSICIRETSKWSSNPLFKDLPDCMDLCNKCSLNFCYDKIIFSGILEVKVNPSEM